MRKSFQTLAITGRHMVKIRLARGGAKKKPFYHVVVSDERRSRDGRYIERVGFFNPVAVGGEIPLRLNVERIEYWQSQGAQASERVSHLVKHFIKNGEEQAPARAEPPKSKPKAKPAAAKAEEAAPAAEAAPAEAAAEEQAEAASPEASAAEEESKE